MKREKREAKAAKIKAAAEAKEAERVAAQKAERQACVVWECAVVPLSTRRLTCACAHVCVDVQVPGPHSCSCKPSCQKGCSQEAGTAGIRRRPAQTQRPVRRCRRVCKQVLLDRS